MLRPKDCEDAKGLFKDWDLKRRWATPTQAFIEHTRRKAKDSLELANYLMEKVEGTSELSQNSTATIWVVTVAYYSMFFQAEYLLGLDGRKFPRGTKDTHKTVYLAFIYYYLIKGSDQERTTSTKTTTSRMSRALALFKELQDETMELQRVERKAEDLDRQRRKRQDFTYEMNRTAKISEAKNSLMKAKEFRTLIEECLLARKTGITSART
ncbi:MAG: hypothetical protein ACLFO2_00655 [Candidatus Woesearchaeota archaeon]